MSLSYKYYQAVVGGIKKDLPISTLKRLANDYGIEVWQLLGPTVPETRIKIAGRFENLSFPQIDTVPTFDFRSGGEWPGVASGRNVSRKALVDVLKLTPCNGARPAKLPGFIGDSGTTV